MGLRGEVGVKSLFCEIRMNYGKISPHPGKMSPLVMWDFTMPMMLCLSCKHKMKIQGIVWEGRISPLSLWSGR